MDTIGFRDNPGNQPEKNHSAGMQKEEIPDMLSAIRDKLNAITSVLDEDSSRQPSAQTSSAAILPEEPVQNEKGNILRFPQTAEMPEAPSRQTDASGENGEEFAQRLANIEVLLGELVRNKYLEIPGQNAEPAKEPEKKEKPVKPAKVKKEKAPKPEKAARKENKTSLHRMPLVLSVLKNIILQLLAMGLFFGACTALAMFHLV